MTAEYYQEDIQLGDKTADVTIAIDYDVYDGEYGITNWWIDSARVYNLDGDEITVEFKALEREIEHSLSEEGMIEAINKDYRGI